MEQKSVVEAAPVIEKSAVVIETAQHMYSMMGATKKMLMTALRAVTAADNESAGNALKEAQSAARWLEGAADAARRMISGGVTVDNVNRLEARLGEIKKTLVAAEGHVTKSNLEGPPREAIDGALARVRQVYEAAAAFHAKAKAQAK